MRRIEGSILHRHSEEFEIRQRLGLRRGQVLERPAVQQVVEVAVGATGLIAHLESIGEGSWGGTIKLWDVATGKEQATLKGHTDTVVYAAYSPDGKTLASGDGHDRINLWDISVAKKPDK